jgi:hypothetical protein
VIEPQARSREGWFQSGNLQDLLGNHPSRADGVVLAQKNVDLLISTTPSAPSKVASRYFLNVASTPPQLRRGIGAAQKFVHILYDGAYIL